MKKSLHFSPEALAALAGADAAWLVANVGAA